MKKSRILNFGNNGRIRQKNIKFGQQKPYFDKIGQLIFFTVY